MLKIGTLLKIINKKYDLDEFLLISKVYSDSYEVLVIDILNNKIYLEENYPDSLIKDSKIKEFTKKEFLLELTPKMSDIMKINFPKIHEELSLYNEQKSLF